MISCFHPVVAQKSYGEEKRFLCPPPIVAVSTSSSPSFSSPSFDPLSPSSFSAAVVTDDGPAAGADQHQAVVDENGKACFKSLHVTSASRSKSFHLKIKANDGATLTSRPIAIVSKPSKKTTKGGKGGDASSSIPSGTLVSFYNRVNSQTVRTKFLGNEMGQLSARNSTWTPFTIDIVENGRIKVFDAPTPILYGQEVILRDLESGFCSEVLLLQKADKSPNSSEGLEGSPVTHLQKITLQSKERPGHFLTVSQSLFGSSDPLLSFQRPVKGPDAASEDLMCWSIVGIEKTTLSIRTH